MPDGPQNPKIYDVIRTAHRIASSLLEELADTSEQDIARRERLLAEVERELAVHARTEEAVFYDLLLRNPATRGLVEEAQQEHDVVLRLVNDLAGARAGGEVWDDMIAELASTVAQHIAEEESELFPAMEQLLDDDQARALAETFQSERAKIECEEFPTPGAVCRAGGQPSLGSVGGPGDHPVAPAPAEHRRPDESIAEDIREQLTRQSEIDAAGIGFRVFDGEVTLTGIVDDRATKFRVEELVEDVLGVTDVYNFLSIRPNGGETTGFGLAGGGT